MFLLADAWRCYTDRWELESSLNPRMKKATEIQGVTGRNISGHVCHNVHHIQKGHRSWVAER